jgi:hypothetical protein
MHTLLPLIGLLVIVGILAVVIQVVLPGLRRGPAAFPYQKEPALFTPAERSFLSVLDSALGPQFRILGKVRLADVIKVQSGLGGSARQQAFNRIQSKHLDFVICDPNDLSVKFVVELDDSSHQQSHRQARDAFLDKALAAAGVPVFHFAVKRTYSMPEIRGVLFQQPAPAQKA